MLVVRPTSVCGARSFLLPMIRPSPAYGNTLVRYEVSEVARCGNATVRPEEEREQMGNATPPPQNHTSPPPWQALLRRSRAPRRRGRRCASTLMLWVPSSTSAPSLTRTASASPSSGWWQAQQAAAAAAPRSSACWCCWWWCRRPCLAHHHLQQQACSHAPLPASCHSRRWQHNASRPAHLPLALLCSLAHLRLNLPPSPSPSRPLLPSTSRTLDLGGDGPLLVDFSKNRITAETLDLLLGLAREVGLGLFAERFPNQRTLALSSC